MRTPVRPGRFRSTMRINSLPPGTLAALASVTQSVVSDAERRARPGRSPLKADVRRQSVRRTSGMRPARTFGVFRRTSRSWEAGTSGRRSGRKTTDDPRKKARRGRSAKPGPTRTRVGVAAFVVTAPRPRLHIRRPSLCSKASGSRADVGERTLAFRLPPRRRKGYSDLTSSLSSKDNDEGP